MEAAMATSAGPAGLTAAGAEEREGAAAAGSDPAAPSAGPAAFLRLPAPFNEEGNRARGGRCRRDRAPAGAEGKAGPGGAAAGPAEAPEGARPGGTGAWGQECVCVGSWLCRFRRWGSGRRLAGWLPLCAPSLLRAARAEPRGPAGGGGDRPAPLQKPPGCGSENTLRQPPPPGPFSPGAELTGTSRTQKFSV